MLVEATPSGSTVSSGAGQTTVDEQPGRAGRGGQTAGGKATPDGGQVQWSQRPLWQGLWRCPGSGGEAAGGQAAPDHGNVEQSRTSVR